MRLTFDLRYALRSLRRDGTRTFLAGLCVAFGVMSLISMQLLSTTLLHGSLFDSRLFYGGDVQITAAQDGQPLSEAEIQQIETWKQQGLVTAYTPVANGDSGLIRTEDSGRVSIVMTVWGIDPTTYPLIGQLALREPAGQTPADVLRQPTDALLTQDMADALNLRIGDRFMLGDGQMASTWLTLAGIVNATPSQQGRMLFYSLETAHQLQGRDDVVQSVSALIGDQPGAVDSMVNSPLRVFVASGGMNSSATSVFDLMLKGAGVLGLIVGGIGVSNTLQVILARRKLEIAMLKTVGFVRGDLLRLIGLEAGLIGVIGGLAGGALGIVVTGKLLEVLSSSGILLITWTPDWSVVLAGLVAGAATAVVFGLQAILASSATRPVELLRDLPLRTPPRTWAIRLALYGLLIVIFGVLVGFLTGSVLEGIALVIGGGLLLVALRTVFWVILWLMLRLPLPRMPLLRLARNNLRTRKLQSSLALIALFAGTFAVSFAAIAIANGQERILNVRGSDDGYNLAVVTTPAEAESVIGQMVSQGALSLYSNYVILSAMLDGQPIVVNGRTAGDIEADVTLSDGSVLADWQDNAGAALLPRDRYGEQYIIGDQVTLAVGDQKRTLTVVGFYTGRSDSELAPFLSGDMVILPREVALELGGERVQVGILGEFPVSALDTAANTLGEAYREALVVSKADLNDVFVSAYHSLFGFAAAVAGLAFVAGAVLIANSAGLLMIERRREIGVFKAVGYTSSHVLRLLLGEYAILGLLGGLFGLIGVFIAITLINNAEPNAGMKFEPLVASATALLSVVIALGSAALVAWQPTRVRPLDVLRYE